MNPKHSSVWLTAAMAALIASSPAGRQPDSATAVLRGFPNLRSVASDPQASLLIGAGAGEISRLAARNLAVPLAATRGAADGLAFDAAESLYVADSRRKAILKVTPWGDVSVFTDRCGGTPVEPVRVAVSAAGEVFFTDRAGGRVCRATVHGETSLFSSGFTSPSGIAVSAASGSVFVADSDGRVWTLAGRGKRVPFASLTGSGKPGGMALDDKGNLYVARDGGGRVSVLSPSGKPLEDLAVPGPGSTDVAFAGATLEDLYVTESVLGSLFRLRARSRSQRLPWEDDAPLAITEPVDGAILNRHDGAAAGSGLRIGVKGICRAGATVRVNGVAVPVREGRFETSLVLTSRETAIQAEAGRDRSRVTVFWDRDSFARYRVSVDDNIWFLRDIARNQATYTPEIPGSLTT